MLYRVLVIVISFLAGVIVYSSYNQYNARIKKQIIAKFVTAWNARDIETVMSLMADDPIFFTSSGAEAYGSKYMGRDAVRAAFLQVMNAYLNGKWLGAGEIYISGNYATAPFLFQESDENGNMNKSNGIDLLVFKGNKILIKDGYRKFKG